MKPYWQTADGRHVLYLGDCLEVLPEMGGGSLDAVVTDPPYGIGEARANNKSRSMLAPSQDYGVSAWDDRPCLPEQIAEMRRVSRWQVIFGGNFFDLPPTSCYLVWDKMNGENDFADCELAWTNLKKAVRRLSFRWHGMIRDERCERVHPTQKPVGVMVWAMSHLPDAETILDAFAGSGTTLVACVRTGRKSIGIEIDERYCEIVANRMEAELNACPLFEPRTPTIRQGDLALDEPSMSLPKLN